MKSLNLMLKIVAVGGLLAVSKAVLAGCTVITPVTETAGNIPTTLTIPSSQVAGTPIGGEISVPDSGIAKKITCLSGPVNSFLRLNAGWSATVFPDVYQTSIPGIGVKVREASYVGNLNPVTPNPGIWHYVGTSYVNGNGQLLGIYVQFYLTGAVTPGVYSPEIFVENWLNDSATDINNGANYVTLMLPQITIKKPGCTTPNIRVNLEKHQTSEFSGLYSTSAAKSFNFEVKNCSSDTTTVSYTFKPATSAGVSLAQANTSRQHLTLNSTSSATGVGVQVLDQHDVLIPFNSKITSGYTAGANGYVIPMKARYIKTASTITAGQADSALEFTMTYE